MKSILLVKNLLGLVQMTSGLVNASFSSPEWQAVKMIFFAPCHNTPRKLPHRTTVQKDLVEKRFLELFKSSN